MRRLEYEAKRLLSTRAVHLHIGALVKIGEMPRSLGFLLMLKAQIQKGGQEARPIRTRLRISRLRRNLYWGGLA